MLNHKTLSVVIAPTTNPNPDTDKLTELENVVIVTKVHTVFEIFDNTLYFSSF